MKTNWFAAYDQKRWLEFYFEGLDYIIELNKRGLPFVELYAAIDSRENHDAVFARLC